MRKAWSLFLLRVSLGGLLIIWGVNKVVNVEYSLAISDNYYSGILSSEMLIPLGGVGQILIGLLVVFGLARRWVYPLQLLINGVSLLVVSASVVDPWGWYLDGTNMLFYPSLIIFAGSLVVMAFREEDTVAFGARRRLQPATWRATHRCRS